ncbi:MAG: Hpt domain-containing protein [Cyanobacteria bacterium]|nr:Hpt domain-containing protein [Cyanobacteriota bacterium]MDW8199989.1 Hpt domain-containing protein [Cyanobacteriota bacterium SKYGB_h_bin112]
MTDRVDASSLGQPVTAQMLTTMGMDWERLRDLSGGLAEFELELLAMFVEDTQLHVDAAKAAIKTQNFTQLGREAHQIKGASANVGAIPMQQAAAQLEQQAKQQALDRVDELLATLQAWLMALRTYVQQTNTPT